MSIESFPTKDEQFFIEGNAGQIEAKAMLAKDNQRNATMVICHPHPLFEGTMENKVVTTVFRAFNQMGFNTVRFNYRGVGKSAGEYGATIGESEDLLSVVDWVKQRRPEDELWLTGFSFGSYIAAKSANTVNAKQLISIAPAVKNFDFDAIDFPQCPWLVIQGEEDEVVPADLVFDWVAKQTKPPKLIKFPETTHFFHGKLTDLKTVFQTEFVK